jgi:hypothetical protein
MLIIITESYIRLNTCFKPCYDFIVEIHASLIIIYLEQDSIVK